MDIAGLLFKRAPERKAEPSKQRGAKVLVIGIMHHMYISVHVMRTRDFNCLSNEVKIQIEFIMCNGIL